MSDRQVEAGMPDKPSRPPTGMRVGFDRLDALTPRTLVAQAVEAILGAVALGQFLPGDRLVESEIARRLGISRVPVREALRLLESQGIVHNEPFKGMRLMNVTSRDCREMVVIAREFVHLAVRTAMAKPAVPDRWEGVRRSVEALRSTAPDPHSLFLAQSEVMQQIYLAADNRLLSTMALALRARFSVYASLLTTPERLLARQPYLETLVACIEAGDAASVARSVAKYFDPDTVPDVEALLAEARRRQKRRKDDPE
ncbi:GntR family transcriptional regulator [Roseomonas sp. NAR14]|uniref:GntR family transcriptional regulator n=1 Tax=Roseomonas acroporae TaxID=2937791 RepID=A0A9X1Y710_9PROT|nr:GntR family transcriptional regulator [Roseomonas acroporae]MCK8783380.1 GntR family transcriptional regulator [Roseomonas acroporae]